MSHEIVPAYSGSGALSTATVLARLIPAKILNLAGGKAIYYLERSTKRGYRSDPRDCAMLTMVRGENTFKLAYYPVGAGEVSQIVKDLPVSMLAQAVEDLAGAGFPVQRVIVAKPSVPPQEPPKQISAPIAQLDRADDS